MLILLSFKKNFFEIFIFQAIFEAKMFLHEYTRVIFIRRINMGDIKVSSINGIKGSSGSSSVAKNDKITISVGQEKTVDSFGHKIVKKPEDLKNVSYEVKSGDSFMKIAKHFGIKPDAVVVQLKDKGLLPKDYNPYEVHNTDPKVLREGNQIQLSLPKNPAQKEDYKKWIDYKIGYYNNFVKAAEVKKSPAPEEKSLWNRIFGK